MKPLGLSVVLALVLSAGAASVQDSTEIQRKGDRGFTEWTDDDPGPGPGDTIRTGDSDVVWTYDDDTEWWLGEDSEMVYHSSHELELIYGQMEVIDDRSRATNRFKVIVGAFDVTLDQGGAQIGASDENEVQIDAHPDFDRSDIRILAVKTGFRMKIFEGQMVSLFHDRASDETRIVVPEESVDRVVVELSGNALRVVGGDVTKQELFLGHNRIGIPGGVELVMGKALVPLAPEGAMGQIAAGPVAISEQDLAIPQDQPYEDAGDVAFVANVSPSQP